MVVINNHQWITLEDEIFVHLQGTSKKIVKIYSGIKQLYPDEIKIPYGIEIITEPTTTEYTAGDVIDYSGIVVRLLDENNNPFRNRDYPDGIIPFNELIFPIVTATGQRYDFTARSDSLVYEPSIIFENNGSWSPVRKTNSGKSAGLISTNFHGSDNWFGCLLMSLDSSSSHLTYNGSGRVDTLTIDGATIYVASMSSNVSWGGATACSNPLGLPMINEYVRTLNAPIRESELRHVMDILDFRLISSGTIPVQWQSPYDHNTFEDAFNISID